ncbi:Plasma membrane t-SNARE, secretory vesicle fusion [Chytriomyces hyalinus]|nr:Plasma membrane t-SNARE, secretory vesicle fusion [Chytriomyces hyalinus]
MTDEATAQILQTLPVYLGWSMAAFGTLQTLTLISMIACMDWHFKKPVLTLFNTTLFAMTISSAFLSFFIVISISSETSKCMLGASLALASAETAYVKYSWARSAGIVRSIQSQTLTQFLNLLVALAPGVCFLQCVPVMAMMLVSEGFENRTLSLTYAACYMLNGVLVVFFDTALLLSFTAYLRNISGGGQEEKRLQIVAKHGVLSVCICYVCLALAATNLTHSRNPFSRNPFVVLIWTLAALLCNFVCTVLVAMKVSLWVSDQTHMLRSSKLCEIVKVDTEELTNRTSRLASLMGNSDTSVPMRSYVLSKSGGNASNNNNSNNNNWQSEVSQQQQFVASSSTQYPPSNAPASNGPFRPDVVLFSPALDMNTFYRQRDLITQYTATVESNIAAIKQLNNRVLQEVNQNNTIKLKAQLDELITETSNIVQATRDALKVLQKSRKGDKNTRKGQYEFCLKKLQAAAGSFLNVQNEIKMSKRDQIARQYRIAKPNASEHEIQEALDSGRDVFAEMMLSSRVADQQRQLSAVQERQKELNKVLESMGALQQLMQEMSDMINQQQEWIDESERFVDNTVRNVEAGVVQLTDANKKAASARRTKWMIFWIILVIVIIIAAVVAWQVVQNKK